MTWWRRVFNRNRLEHELDAELRDHVDRLVAELIAKGHSHAEAVRLARLEFGGVDQVKEACRDERGTRWIDEAVQDARHGARSFRKHPGFAAAAILTLSLGVGANLAVFNLVDALLLRPLPVPDAAGLITLTRWMQGNSSEHFSYPQVQALAGRRDLFSAFAGVGSGTVHVGPPDVLEPTGVAWVTGQYFDALRLMPVAGRLLTPADDGPGAVAVAIISHDYWMRRFGGTPDAVGRTILMEGQPVAIVGVTPAPFMGATIGERADITLAVHAMSVLQPENGGRTTADARWLRVIGRPTDDVPAAQLQSRLDVVWPQVNDATLRPGSSGESRRRQLSMTLTVEDGSRGTSTLRGNLGTPLTTAMWLVILVLAIACVNVANLLLARGVSREREVALRLAIGAGRARIVRQLLTESAMLAIVGVTVGLAIAWMGSSTLVGMIAERVMSRDGEVAFLDVALNARIILATVFVAIVTTLTFGIVPAWRASAIAPAALVASARVAESQGRVRSGLIVAQVALSLIVVVGAGVFARSLHNLRTLDRGFETGTVVLAAFDPTRAQPSREALVAFNRDVLRQARTLPGVRSASLAVMTPLQGGGMSQPMLVNGVSTGSSEIHFNFVAPKYFDIVGTPILMGRDLAESDHTAAPLVAIVNQTFARRFLEGLDPLGQRVKMAFTKGDMQIVGVVKDAVYETLRAPAPPTVYASYLQMPGQPMSLVVDARAPIADVTAELRKAIQPRVPAAPLRIRTLASQIDVSLFTDRLMTLLASIFGTLAVVLAAIGLYGLLAFNVAARTREIGVRLALGARPSRVLGMVLGSAMRKVVAGIAIGIPGAWLASRAIGGITFRVAPGDPLVLGLAVVVLLAAGVIAAAVPARRAATVDPASSMHVE